MARDRLTIAGHSRVRRRARFVACTLSMDILGFKEEEMIDGLEYAGVAAYLGDADEANVNLFI